MKRSSKRSKSHVKATTPQCQFLAQIGAHHLDKVLCLKLKRVDDPQIMARAKAMKSGASAVGKDRKTTISDVKTLCPKRVVIRLGRVTVADKSKNPVQKMAPPKYPIRRRDRQI